MDENLRRAKRNWEQTPTEANARSYLEACKRSGLSFEQLSMPLANSIALSLSEFIHRRVGEVLDLAGLPQHELTQKNIFDCILWSFKFLRSNKIVFIYEYDDSSSQEEMSVPFDFMHIDANTPLMLKDYLVTRLSEEFLEAPNPNPLGFNNVYIGFGDEGTLEWKFYFNPDIDFWTLILD